MERSLHGWGGMDRTFHIVAGIEMDATGEVVFERVVDLTSGMTNYRIHFCHACGDATEDSERADRHLSEGEARLQRWAVDRVLGTPMMGNVDLHVALGTGDEVLCQLAADLEAELIVVGTHHKNRWQQLAKGSVMQKLVDHAPCSVLVAMAHAFDDYDKSPSIEPPRKSRSAAPHFAHPHTYRYRRSIPMVGNQSTFGSGADPMHPSR